MSWSTRIPLRLVVPAVIGWTMAAAALAGPPVPSGPEPLDTGATLVASGPIPAIGAGDAGTMLALRNLDLAAPTAIQLGLPVAFAAAVPDDRAADGAGGAIIAPTDRPFVAVAFGAAAAEPAANLATLPGPLAAVAASVRGETLAGEPPADGSSLP